MPRKFTPSGQTKLIHAKALLKNGHNAKHQKYTLIGRDCSICQHAQTKKAGKGWSLICTLGMKEPAPKCPAFKDARKPRQLPRLGET